MQKLKLGYNRFVFGETSSLLAARSDLLKYPAGCGIMRNFIPLLQGPAQRRGGTRFIAQTGSGGQPVILAEFTRSESISYIIEIGARTVSGEEQGYARFFRDGQPIRVSDASDDPYELFTPWLQADLFDAQGLPALKWVQSADVLFVVCPTKPPYRINRFGDNNWTLSLLGGWGARGSPQAIALYKERLVMAVGHKLYFSQSGAFENFELKTYVMTEISATGNTYATFSGDTIRVQSDFALTSTVSFMPGEASFVRSADGRTVTATAIDPEEGFSRVTVAILGSTAYGWFLDTRTSTTLVGGSLDKHGAKITGLTVTFDPETTEVTTNTSGGDGVTLRPRSDVVAADDPIEIEILSEQVDDVTWLSPGEDLLVGTTGGEFAIGAQSSADPLGPKNIKISPQTAFGSAPIQALRVGSVLLFVQRSGMKIREFLYDSYSENYVAGDISAAAEHITRGGVTAIAWQSEPLETVWMVRADGVLLGLTYSKDQEMAAWHRHHLGGEGQVSHLAVIPAVHGGRDELWLSVRHEVNGETVYYLERLEPGHEYGGVQTDCFFVDSGITVKGSGLTVVTGLSHLEGLEVDILADGGVQPRQIVQAGRVTLDSPADIVQAGLPYRSVLETVNLDLEMKDGVVQGRIKRFTQVQLMLIESLGGAIGDLETGALTDLDYRLGSTPLDSPPELFTGLKMVNWPGSFDRQGRLGVVQDAPLPLTLAAIYPAASIENMRS